MWKCRSRGRVPGWGRDHPRRRRAAVRLGLGDEARDGGGGARRGRGGDRRARRAGRPAGLDRPAPARARLGPAVRRRRAARRSPGRGGSTRTAGSSWPPTTSPRPPRCRSRSTSRASGASRSRGSPAYGVEAPLERARRVALELLSPSRVAAETLAEAAAVQFPGLAGVLPGFGRQEPNDWGLGLELRDGEAPALDGRAQLAGHVRPLRPGRQVPLGRPRRRRRPRLSHRS